MAIKKDTKVKKTTTNTKRSDIKEITNGALIILIIFLLMTMQEINLLMII